MISFIKQEAKEKAEDIKRDIDKEAGANKLNQERAFTQQIKEEFARKKKERVTEKKLNVPAKRRKHVFRRCVNVI